VKLGLPHPHIKGRRYIEMFGNEILRNIFGTKREEVEDAENSIHNSYSSPNVTRKIK
jgi:hypothetical protein